MKTIGLFGGTFDPVHMGHLRMALEFKEKLQFDEMHLLPCHLPPLKEAPARTSAQRLVMVELAIADYPQLQVDARELNRPKASYTLDTLQEIRAEQGDDVSLCWCVGMDSLNTINLWYHWRELLDYAHLVVAARPGWTLPIEGEVAEWLKSHRLSADKLSLQPQGGVVIETLSLVDVSSTALREALASSEQLTDGLSEQLPTAVYDYIEQHGLYRDSSVKVP